MDAKTILVVEDEPLIRVDLASILVELGYSVIEAGTLDDAKTLARERKPDVIFTDINLGVGDEGLELATWVLNELPATGLILCSGNANEAAGDSYVKLEKPFTVRDVAHVLEQVGSFR